MTQISERIRQAIALLERERDTIERQIHELKQNDSKTKSSMHNLELRIMSEGLTEDPSNQSARIRLEAAELLHDRKVLHQDEVELKNLTQKLKDLQKKITTHQFWMKYGNTDDEVKQLEAQRKVFGH